tara:strand:- start:37 stop:471 length:435 start_codon:yes stop_codon:yes gene_type:complete
METYQIWISIGILLLIAEIFTPGFILACFGMACFVTSLGTFFDITLNTQLILFAFSSILIFIGIRPFFTKFDDFNNTESGVDAMINQICIVTENIDNLNDTGYIKYGSEHWKAKSLNNNNIQVKSKVKIIKIIGSTVYVELHNS